MLHAIKRCMNVVDIDFVIRLQIKHLHLCYKVSPKMDS